MIWLFECAISSTVRGPYATHWRGSGLLRLAAVLSCQAVICSTVPRGSSGAASGSYM